MAPAADSLRLPSSAVLVLCSQLSARAEYAIVYQLQERRARVGTVVTLKSFLWSYERWLHLTF